MEQGKSAELNDHGRQQNVRRTLGGDDLRNSQSDKYIGMGLSARGAVTEPVDSRVDGASATLATLKLSKELVRGMEMRKATEMHSAFLKSN